MIVTHDPYEEGSTFDLDVADELDPYGARGPHRNPERGRRKATPLTVSPPKAGPARVGGPGGGRAAPSPRVLSAPRIKVGSRRWTVPGAITSVSSAKPISRRFPLT